VAHRLVGRVEHPGAAAGLDLQDGSYLQTGTLLGAPELVTGMLKALERFRRGLTGS
jgi:hypothetical protein